MAFESDQQLLIFNWVSEAKSSYSLADDDIEYVMEKWDKYYSDLKETKKKRPFIPCFCNLNAFCQMILRKFTFDSMNDEEELLKLFYDLQKQTQVNILFEVKL